MLNDWKLVDHDSILYMMKKSKIAHAKVMKGRKSVSYKQQTIPACYGKIFSVNGFTNRDIIIFPIVEQPSSEERYSRTSLSCR